MFDIAPSEFMLVAFVALIVIGPKDLPKAMRIAGYWVGRARGVARQFRSGFDQMVREAELEDMEKKWKAENERIMREHPAELHDDDAAPAVMTGQPVIVDHPAVAPASQPTHLPEPAAEPPMAPESAKAPS